MAQVMIDIIPYLGPDSGVDEPAVLMAEEEQQVMDIPESVILVYRID